MTQPTAQPVKSPRPLRLVVVSAGLSKPSSTRLLADRLAESTVRRLIGGEDGVEIAVTVVELRDHAVDIANNLVAGFPAPALREALEAVDGADGLIVVTPVFAASYSGLFKSFFDLVEPDTLSGTPVLLAATGGTARHSLVLEHALRPLFSYLHALTVPSAVFAATDDWGTTADTHAGGLPARIDRASAELAALLRRMASTAGTAGTAAATAVTSAADGGPDEGAAEEVVPFEQLLANLS